jgi:hypothetical protein
MPRLSRQPAAVVRTARSSSPLVLLACTAEESTVLLASRSIASELVAGPAKKVSRWLFPNSEASGLSEASVRVRQNASSTQIGWNLSALSARVSVIAESTGLAPTVQHRLCRTHLQRFPAGGIARHDERCAITGSSSEHKDTRYRLNVLAMISAGGAQDLR